MINLRFIRTEVDYIVSLNEIDREEGTKKGRSKSQK